MFLLDTNVVSELMRATPALNVLSWMDRQSTQDLFVTAVTEAEIRAGIAILPEGVRRRGLDGCCRANAWQPVRRPGSSVRQ